MKMKRFIMAAIIFLLALAITFSGYGETTSNEKISIVCTTFPQYDWVRQILGYESDNVDMTLLLDSRIDLHNYQPSVDDIVKISTCDLFIYVGGESDGWVDRVLSKAINEDMVVINLLDTLGTAAKTEEIIKGMEKQHEDEDHMHQNEEAHADETEYDEHVWLSLKNAQAFCAAIADALSSLDADNTEVYQSNLIAYIEKLSALDSEYQAATNAAPVKTLLFGDRFPFRYLVDDYGLNYHAAFAGCSAETEASFDTIIILAGKVDELNLRNIMVTESSDRSIANTIRNNTTGKNQQILVLDAMQSVILTDVQNGTTYLSIMESNLNILIEALK